MPIFKIDDKLIYYAHVPKCGGSAISWYLAARFGKVAFSDRRHTEQPALTRWSRTSPQHIDTESLDRLFPENFFDAIFSIVRHPVPRLVSAYHFQRDLEGAIDPGIKFGEWLTILASSRGSDPFELDNHFRPMNEIVPKSSKVFYMEHSLDAMIPWLDEVTGQASGPRAIPQVNRIGEHSGGTAEKVRPTEEEIGLIGEIYAADYARFGYDPTRVGPPDLPAPELRADFVAERNRAAKVMKSPIWRFRRKLAARLLGS